MKGSDLVFDFLDRTGTSVVFGVSGANCEDLFESIHRKGKIKIILSKSEYGAATMAIGYYLAHKKTGVVITTSGPGILNTIPVLAEAFTSKIPLLVIAGSVDEAAEGEGAFQDTSGKSGTLNVASILAACTGYHAKLTDENIQEKLFQAFDKAKSSHLPSVIEIPKNISQKEFKNIPEITCESETQVINQDVFNQAIYFCEAAVTSENKVLVVLGDECMHLRTQSALSAFADNLDCTVVATPNAKGSFNNSSHRFAGLLGIMGHENALNAFKNSTHVLFLGFNNAKLNTIGIESELNIKTSCHLNYENAGDLDLVLKKLSEYKFTEIKKIKQNVTPIPEKSASGFTMENILAEIQRKQNNDLNVFVDAGNTGAYVVHNFQCNGNGVFSISLGMGGMGNSIGTAIGAASLKTKRSLVFLGDGSFLIQGMEIHTALQYNLPVTFYILNNNSHAMCATREKLFLKGESGINKFKSSFFAAGILKMFPGIPAREIFSMSDLEECMNDFKNARGPVVLSINISNTDYPPFLTFKRSIS
jgi:acetolactate synthase-1/2/3 large subunit